MAPKRDKDFIGVYLPSGSFAEIDPLLYGGELRTGFVREAIAREIKRRTKEYETDPRRAAPPKA